MDVLWHDHSSAKFLPEGIQAEELVCIKLWDGAADSAS